MSSHTQDALARLLTDGLIEFVDGRYRTTRRWQGAMSRAALRLLRAGHEGTDLRVPIVNVLLELYGTDCPDEELVALTQALVPIESTKPDLSPDSPTP